MFGSNKAAVVVAAAQDKSKPLIAGSAAMMLKSLGINPDEVDKVARELIGTIDTVGKRLDGIEARLARIENRLDSVPVTLTDEA